MEEIFSRIETDIKETFSAFHYEQHRFPGSAFTSGIKFEGVPILPPLMTHDRRDEMKFYQRQAVITETRIRACQRQKLFQRVQSVINAIDERHTPAPNLPDDVTTLSETQDTSETAESAINAVSSQPGESDYSYAITQNQVTKNVSEVTDLNQFKKDEETDATSARNNPDSGFSSNRDPIISNLGDVPSLKASVEPLDTMTDITDLSSETGNEADDQSEHFSHRNATTFQEVHDEKTVFAMLENKTNFEKPPSNFEYIEQEEITGSLLQEMYSAMPADANLSSNPEIYSSGEDAIGNNHLLAVSTLKSSSSSGTSLSNDEMNRTIISKEDALSLLNEQMDDEDHKLTVIDQPEYCETLSTSSQTDQDNFDNDQLVNTMPGTLSTQSSLLSRVDLTLDDGTPDTEPTTSVTITESDSEKSSQPKLISHVLSYDENTGKEAVQVGVSQGESSFRTGAQYLRERTTSGGGVSSLGSDTEEMSHYYTTSTELAPYMAVNSLETARTATTLPHIHDNNDTICSNDQSLRTEVADAETDSDGTQHSEDVSKQSKTSCTPARIRRDSYTLEHPSPALLKADVDDVGKEISTSKEVPLTNSMEDLKLRPAQRSLSYDDHRATPVSLTQPPVNTQAAILTSVQSSNQITQIEARERYNQEKEGKEEHLHKYLQHLSEMPDSPQQQQASINNSCNQSDLDDSLSSGITHNFAVALQNTPFDGEAIGTLSEEELLNLQASYFERLRRQLIEQQRQQLSQLLAEQESQQLALQNDLLSCRSTNLSQTSSLSDKHQTPAKKLSQKPKRKVKQQSVTHDVSFDPDLRPVSAPVPQFTGHEFSGHVPLSSAHKRTQNYDLPSPAVLRTKQHRDPGKTPSPHSKTFSPKHNVRHSTDTRLRSKQDSAIRVQDIPPEYHHKFKKLSALVKGHLTRQLMKSYRVQNIINTIKDTAEFALNFQQETPIKKGHYSLQDKRLQERVIAQLTAAMYEIHEVFFETPKKEQMLMIVHTQQMQREKYLREQGMVETAEARHISAATLKARERKKKAQLAEASVMAELRPKSAPPPQTSSAHSHEPSSARHDPLGVGALQRHHKFLMNRALHPTPASSSPVKPVKDNLNRVTALKDKQHKTAKPSAVVKPISSAKTQASSRPKTSANVPAKINSKTAKIEPTPLVPHANRKVSRPPNPS